MLLADLKEGKNMQSETEIRRLLDATNAGDAAGDWDLATVRRILEWILGDSAESLDLIIQEELIDAYK